MIYRILHNAAWSASLRGNRWIPALIYRCICPYPIEGKLSIKACQSAGNCGCDNKR